jgi:hypothetical protein
MSDRPSTYLVSKCQAVEQALAFFLGDVSAIQKRIMFLAQIDFWSWEMDELIYSVQNFEERAKAWKSNRGGLDQLLRTHGIVLKTEDINEASWRSRWQADVSAPIEGINATIDKWNDLLALCEGSLFSKKAKKQKEQYGMEILTDLKQYKKNKI